MRFDRNRVLDWEGSGFALPSLSVRVKQILKCSGKVRRFDGSLG